MNIDRRDLPFIRGFIIGPAALPVDGIIPKEAAFQEHALNETQNLWVESSQEFAYAHRGESSVYIIGRVYNADDPKDRASIIAEKLLACVSDDGGFHLLLSMLSGRFAIVRQIDNHSIYVYHDTAGCRSIYYSTTVSVVASHYSLARRLILGDSQPEERPRVGLTADLTNIDELYALLPNFRLSLSDMEPQRYFPVISNEFTGWTEEARLNEIQRLWHNSNEALFTQNEKVALSITGGADSRLTLALLRKYWKRVHSFTYGLENSTAETNYGKVMCDDFYIAHQLVEMLDLKKHSFIDLASIPAISPELSQLISTNTPSLHGPRQVAAYRDTYPGDDWVHIRSTATELIRGHWGSQASEQRMYKMMGTGDNADKQARVRKLGYTGNLSGYSNTDLFHWEIRMGRWHTEILNENDAAFDTVLPHAVRRLFDLFLSFDYEVRKSSRLIHRLVELNAPWLHFIGVNDRQTLWQRYNDLRSAPASIVRPARSTPVLSDSRSPKVWREAAIRLSGAGSGTPVALDPEGFLAVPANAFVENASITAELLTCAERADIFIEVETPYMNPRANHYFRYEVQLDGKPVAIIGGGSKDRNYLIAMTGVAMNSQVSVSIRCLRTAQARSWERASRLRLLRATCRPSDQSETVCFADSTDVEIVELAP